jgi:hypothetical protein
VPGYLGSGVSYAQYKGHCEDRGALELGLCFAQYVTNQPLEVGSLFSNFHNDILLFGFPKSRP